MKDYLTIGEVSKLTDLPISTLRYYDSIGIISPKYKDEDTNYRYYRFFQIPTIKMIKHLKSLGFNNAYIKSCLENLNYSHTLSLMNEVIEHTKSEIKRLEKMEIDLKENAKQMAQLIKIEDNKGKFFIEEEEQIGIYEKIEKTENFEGISHAFKKLDSYIAKKDKNLFFIGIWALTFTKESVKKSNYIYDKMVLLKEFKKYKYQFYAKGKYVSLICQGNFEEININVEKVKKWVSKNKYKIVGDTIIEILSGAAFQKNPQDVMYIIKMPIK